MKCDWEKCTIGDLCNPVSETYHGKDSHVVLINTSDVLEGKVLNHQKVENKELKGQFKKTFQKDDILYSEIRPANRRFAFVDFENTSQYVASTKLMVLRPNKEKVSPRFLFSILTSNDVIKELQHLAETRSGTFPQITFSSELANIPVALPTFEIQHKITSILSSLDDKIELNNKINANLEEQAMAIFKSWFVDFEPFGGKMPEDWREYRLSEFLPVITGKKNANVSSAKGEYPFFSCAQDIAWTDDYSFDGSAILVAGNGDFNVKWYSGKFEAYQRTYVLIPYNPRFTSWLYYAVKHSLSDITSAARGSVINFITKGNLENFSFVAPRNLDSFEIIDTFASINKLIETRTRENLRLSSLRDALIPRLLSGELDVSKLTL